MGSLNICRKENYARKSVYTVQDPPAVCVCLTDTWQSCVLHSAGRVVIKLYRRYTLLVFLYAAVLQRIYSIYNRSVTAFYLLLSAVLFCSLLSLRRVASRHVFFPESLPVYF